MTYFYYETFGERIWKVGIVAERNHRLKVSFVDALVKSVHDFFASRFFLCSYFAWRMSEVDDDFREGILIVGVPALEIFQNYVLRQLVLVSDLLFPHRYDACSSRDQI